MARLLEEALRAFGPCCELAEGPVWFRNQLWWVDIEAGRLLNSSGQIFLAGMTVGAALPCAEGQWLLAEEKGFSFWDLHDEPQRFWERPDPSPTYRFNDAKVAPDGSVVAGSLRRGTLEGDCRFYRLESDLHAEEIMNGIGLCNGIGWYEERFYYVDTGAKKVFVRFEGKTRILKHYEDVHPDGLAVDRQGNLWIALWGGSRVDCIHGETGEVLASVPVPVTQVTSCCFGGEDFDTLYITTASTGMDPDQRKQFPDAGAVFACRPGVCGTAPMLFEPLHP